MTLDGNRFAALAELEEPPGEQHPGGDIEELRARTETVLNNIFWASPDEFLDMCRQLLCPRGESRENYNLAKTLEDMAMITGSARGGGGRAKGASAAAARRGTKYSIDTLAAALRAAAGDLEKPTVAVDLSIELHAAVGEYLQRHLRKGDRAKVSTVLALYGVDEDTVDRNVVDALSQDMTDFVVRRIVDDVFKPCAMVYRERLIGEVFFVLDHVTTPASSDPKSRWSRYRTHKATIKSLVRLYDKVLPPTLRGNAKALLGVPVRVLVGVVSGLRGVFLQEKLAGNAFRVVFPGEVKGRLQDGDSCCQHLGDIVVSRDADAAIPVTSRPKRFVKPFNGGFKVVDLDRSVEDMLDDLAVGLDDNQRRVLAHILNMVAGEHDFECGLRMLVADTRNAKLLAMAKPTLSDLVEVLEAAKDDGTLNMASLMDIFDDNGVTTEAIAGVVRAIFAAVSEFSPTRKAAKRRIRSARRVINDHLSTEDRVSAFVDSLALVLSWTGTSAADTRDEPDQTRVDERLLFLRSLFAEERARRNERAQRAQRVADLAVAEDEELHDEVLHRDSRSEYYQAHSAKSSISKGFSDLDSRSQYFEEAAASARDLAAALDKIEPGDKAIDFTRTAVQIRRVMTYKLGLNAGFMFGAGGAGADALAEAKGVKEAAASVLDRLGDRKGKKRGRREVVGKTEVRFRAQVLRLLDSLEVFVDAESPEALKDKIVEAGKETRAAGLKERNQTVNLEKNSKYTTRSAAANGATTTGRSRFKSDKIEMLSPNKHVETLFEIVEAPVRSVADSAVASLQLATHMLTDDPSPLFQFDDLSGDAVVRKHAHSIPRVDRVQEQLRVLRDTAGVSTTWSPSQLAAAVPLGMVVAPFASTLKGARLTVLSEAVSARLESLDGSQKIKKKTIRKVIERVLTRLDKAAALAGDGDDDDDEVDDGDDGEGDDGEGDDDGDDGDDGEGDRRRQRRRLTHADHIHEALDHVLRHHDDTVREYLLSLVDRKVRLTESDRCNIDAGSPYAYILSQPDRDWTWTDRFGDDKAFQLIGSGHIAVLALPQPRDGDLEQVVAVDVLWRGRVPLQSGRGKFTRTGPAAASKLAHEVGTALQFAGCHTGRLCPDLPCLQSRAAWFLLASRFPVVRLASLRLLWPSTSFSTPPALSPTFPANSGHWLVQFDALVQHAGGIFDQQIAAKGLQSVTDLQKLLQADTPPCSSGFLRDLYEFVNDEHASLSAETAAGALAGAFSFEKHPQSGLHFSAALVALAEKVVDGKLFGDSKREATKWSSFSHRPSFSGLPAIFVRRRTVPKKTAVPEGSTIIEALGDVYGETLFEQLSAMAQREATMDSTCVAKFERIVFSSARKAPTMELYADVATGAIRPDAVFGIGAAAEAPGRVDVDDNKLEQHLRNHAALLVVIAALGAIRGSLPSAAFGGQGETRFRGICAASSLVELTVARRYTAVVGCDAGAKRPYEMFVTPADDSCFHRLRVSRSRRDTLVGQRRYKEAQSKAARGLADKAAVRVATRKRKKLLRRFRSRLIAEVFDCARLGFLYPRIPIFAMGDAYAGGTRGLKKGNRASLGTGKETTTLLSHHMLVVWTDECYTSQACPACGKGSLLAMPQSLSLRFCSSADCRANTKPGEPPPDPGDGPPGPAPAPVWAPFAARQSQRQRARVGADRTTLFETPVRLYNKDSTAAFWLAQTLTCYLHGAPRPIYIVSRPESGDDDLC